MSKGKPDNGAALSPADIVNALEGSGYPFEVALHREFTKADMAPDMGHRFLVRDPESPGDGLVSRELDILANYYCGQVRNGYVLGATITPLVEAKRLHEPTRMVGILAPDPDPYQHRVFRAKFHGCPSFGIRDDQRDWAELFLNRGGIAESVMPFVEEPPLCVHWAAVRRKDGAPFASGDTGDADARLHDSLQNLAAITAWLEQENTRHMASVRVEVQPLPGLGLYLPTLAVKTPTLMVYNPLTGDLRDVPWFCLAKNYEIEGHVVHRIIDVVCESGIPNFIAHVKRSGDLLAERMAVHEHRLRELGIGIRKSLASVAMAISVKVPPRRVD
jgi:hypothetical protein